MAPVVGGTFEISYLLISGLNRSRFEERLNSDRRLFCIGIV